jgi:hypothetical protein
LHITTELTLTEPRAHKGAETAFCKAMIKLKMILILLCVSNH